MDRSARFSRLYRNAALFLLNVVVLFVVANAGLYVLFRIKDARTARHRLENVARTHENAALASVYPGMDAGSIDQLVRETWSRPYEYEAFTQFKERACRGRFVNVDEAGFRVSKDQGPWPPNPKAYAVFLFGGSTAFGYGLPDDQSIASYLQEYVRANTSRDVRVYNFGRSSYTSAQERILFEELVRAGFVPDLAVFFDGLNEFAFPDGPAETQRLRAVFDTKPGAVDHWRLVSSLPMTRLARALRRAVVANGRRVDPQNLEPAAALNDPKYDDPVVIARVIDGYFENRRMIEAVAKEFGVDALFVWQPIPLYKYDLKYHVFATGDFGTNAFARHGYRYMERRVREGSLGTDFLWCADVQESLAEPLYVDKVHYTARMSRLVASLIGERIVEQYSLDRAGSGDSIAHSVGSRQP